MFCPQCGANSPDGKKFCTNCGTPLANLQTPEPTPQQPAPSPAQQPAPQQHAAPEPTQPRHAAPAGAAAHARIAEQPTAQQPQPQGAPQPGPMPGGAPAAPKKKSKAPIILAIVLVVLLIGIILIVRACGEVNSIINEYNGSGGNSTAAQSHEGPKPAMSEQDAANSNDTWTILFYVCGSDLETDGGLATYNLQELAQADLGDKVTVVAEAGGAKKWQNSAFSSKYLTRAVFEDGEFNIVDEKPAASMAKAETLEDFIEWGVKEYPADHYMLIMWDHGGGSVVGVCSDELFPGSSRLGDTLTVTEMSTALESAGVKFDVIGFDTCLMATIETATKLAPYADYMVASEESEPGYGWDYVAFPEWLADHTGTDGRLFGEKICDTYFSKCKKYGLSDMATLSVIDLSQMDALAQAFYGASQEIALATVSTEDLRTLTQAAASSSRFGSSTAFNMVDLGDLMEHAQSVVPEYYDDVQDALGNAVVYEVHGKSHPSVSGLSVFYPLDTSMPEFFYEYLNVVGNVPYAQFLAVMYGKYNEVDWSDYTQAVDLGNEEVVQESDMNIKYTESVNSEGNLEMQITQGVNDIAYVNMELAIYLEDKNTIVYLGTDHNVKNPKSGVYTDNFYGKWMAIDGNYVSCNLVEHGDGYNLYSIPIYLNGKETWLVAYYDFSTKEYELLCTSDDIDEHGMAAKSIRKLEDGDKIEFMFGAYNMKTDETSTFTMGSITYNSSTTKMTDEDLGEGLFLYRFVIVDALGDKHDTDFYVQHYQSDGTIVVESLTKYFS